MELNCDPAPSIGTQSKFPGPRHSGHSLAESTEAIILNTLLLHDKRTCKVHKDAQYSSAEDAGRGTSSKAPQVHPIRKREKDASLEIRSPSLDLPVTYHLGASKKKLILLGSRPFRRRQSHQMSWKTTQRRKRSTQASLVKTNIHCQLN